MTAPQNIGGFNGRKFDRIETYMKKFSNRKSSSSSTTTTERLSQFELPFWPAAVRAVPNGFLRSALFGAIRKGTRAYLEREEIRAQEGIRIIYTGPRLDQGDLDVWETILHIARTQALGDECTVTGYQLLKALGKTDTGSNRATLECRLSRMNATGLDVKVGKFSYEGSLIDEVYRDEISRAYVIRLNPRLRALFAADQFTMIDWSVRNSMGGQPLAQWLHGYYASHARPLPVKIETLYGLCGSEMEHMFHFREKLRKSLDVLVGTCMDHGQLFSYEIKNDLVFVEKKGSGSQRRHIAKKARKLPS